MPATYEPTLPTLRDHIRQLMGDTKCLTGGPFIYLDEEIQGKLDRFGFNEALAQLCEGARSRFGQGPVKLNQGMSGGSVEFNFDYLDELAKKARSGEIKNPFSTTKSGIAIGLIKAPDTSVLKLG